MLLNNSELDNQSWRVGHNACVIVGVERVRLVRELTGLWEDAVVEHRMHQVVLQGLTGVGKTAVLQAVYEQLAMSQPRPAYWPSQLGLTRSRPVTPDPQSWDLGMSAARADRVFPEWVTPAAGVQRKFVVEADGVEVAYRGPGAAPSFFWWGLTARPGGFALLDGDPQLVAHIEPIAQAVARGHQLIIDRLRWALDGVFLLGGLGALGATVGGLLQNADNAVDARELGRRAGGVWRSRDALLRQALHRTSGTTFTTDGRQTAVERAEHDGRALGLVASLLPVLVAVQDAQYLDPVTLAFLRVLLSQTGTTGLIILIHDTDQTPTTTSPDGDTFTAWLDRQDRAGRLTRLRVEPLTGPEMTELAVQALGTDLNADALARVVDYAAGIPAVLLDLLAAPSVQAGLHQDGLVPQDLAAIAALSGPRAAWTRLPTDVQHLLAVASVHGRCTLASWLPATKAGTDVLGAAIDAGWLMRRRDSDVVEFTSSHLWDIARSEQARHLTTTACAEARTQVITAIRALRTDCTWDDLDLDVRESLLNCLIDLDLSPGRPQTTPNEGADTARADTEVPPELIAELFTLWRLSGRTDASTRLLGAVADRLTTGQTSSMVLAVATAEALFDAGHLDQALNVLHADYQRLHDEHGPDHPATLAALHNLAAAYAGAARARHGQPQAAPLCEHALGLYRMLLAARESALPRHGPGRAIHLPRLLTTRQQYAQLLAACYHYPQAVTQATTLVDEQRELHGPDHPDTLSTRGNLARWRGFAGDPAGAVTTFRDLLTDRLRILGPDHPDTLTTRGNLARWRGFAGDPAGAAAAAAGLLSDQLRVLGPDHPATLTTRENLAHWRGEAGDTTGAVAANQDLLTDRLRVLGPDHPDTLATRSNLAHWRGEAGDPVGAAAAAADLLSDQLRVLGPDHPDTLTTRSNLADMQGLAGDPAGAAAANQDLLTDQLRVLGPDHPDTLTTRSNLASWQGLAGDPAGAATAFRDLLADQLRVLGPDHPDTLTTRKIITHWRGMTGESVATTG